jgi:glycine cleavage system aminomethyltransferase T
MTLAAAVEAIRSSVALSRLDHVCLVHVRGEDAFDVLDRVVPAQLRVRDGQLLHTLLLDDDAHPVADLYVGRDDEDYFLLAEGPEAGELTALLRRHSPEGADVAIEDGSATHAILGLDGPYAWELLGAALDPEVIGLPYLTFYHRPEAICYRAGKTGEYGYGLIVPRDGVDALEARLRAAGAAYDLRDAGLDALDQCALENWFFNIRREGRARVTPVELQLQWRVSHRKTFTGSEALRRRRADGARERLTCLVADGAMAVGDSVASEDGAIGRIVNAGWSDTRGEWVALALLDIAWAYPGIGDLTAGGAVARTVSPPLLMNRSLAVSPQLHSWFTRHEHATPPLVRP